MLSCRAIFLFTIFMSWYIVANNPDMKSIIVAMNALILNRLATRVNT